MEGGGEEKVENVKGVADKATDKSIPNVGSNNEDESSKLKSEAGGVTKKRKRGPYKKKHEKKEKATAPRTRRRITRDIATQQILSENKDLIIKWFNVSSMRSANARNSEIADVISKKLVRRLGCNLGFLSQIINWCDGGAKGFLRRAHPANEGKGASSSSS